MVLAFSSISCWKTVYPGQPRILVQSLRLNPPVYRNHRFHETHACKGPARFLLRAAYPLPTLSAPGKARTLSPGVNFGGLPKGPVVRLRTQTTGFCPFGRPIDEGPHAKRASVPNAAKQFARASRDVPNPCNRLSV
jgi:hypothetical protein